MTTSVRRFIPFLLGYWGLRAFLLITDFDRYAFPTYEMSPVGLIGGIAVDGWRGVPLHGFFDNCGGHLMWGLASAPLFLGLGSSYLVLKVLPLLLGAVDLWLIWDLAHRLLGKTAARVAALAFLFAPPTLLVYSMLAKGNHFEGLTLQLLTTWFWVRGAQAQRHRSGLWCAAALCAGLSIFAYSGAVIWVVLLLVGHLAARGLPNWRETAMGALGFALGLAPLFWINLQTGRLQGFVDHNLSSSSYFNRLVDLGHNVLLAAPGFRQATEAISPWLGGAWWLAYAVVWAIGVAATVHLMRAHRRGAPERLRLGLVIPLVAYLPGFALAYCLTDFRFRAHEGQMAVGQFRYLVPHLAFASLLFGFGAQWAQELARERRAVLGLAICPVGLGLLSALMMGHFSFERAGAGLHYAAHDKADIARFLLREGTRDGDASSFTWDFQRLREELFQYGEQERERIAFGLGRELARVQGLDGESAQFDLGSILDPMPKELRPAAARGAGAALSQEKSLRSQLRKHLLRALADHPDHAPNLARGLSSFRRGALSRDAFSDFNRVNRHQRTIPYPLRAPWREGQGEFCGTLLTRGFARERALVRELLVEVPEHHRADFWRGVETSWSAAGWTLADLVPLRRQLEATETHIASTPTR